MILHAHTGHPAYDPNVLFVERVFVDGVETKDVCMVNTDLQLVECLMRDAAGNLMAKDGENIYTTLVCGKVEIQWKHNFKGSQ